MSEGARVLTIIIPGTPCRELSPNGRVHHMTRYRAAEAAKTAAYYAAREAVGVEHLCDPVVCLQTGGRIRVDWMVAWERRRQRMDADNLIASLKNTLDGICTILGLDDRRCDVGTVEQVRDRDGGGWIRVTLTEARP